MGPTIANFWWFLHLFRDVGPKRKVDTTQPWTGEELVGVFLIWIPVLPFFFLFIFLLLGQKLVFLFQPDVSLSIANESLPPQWAIGMWESYDSILLDADVEAAEFHDSVTTYEVRRGYKGFREMPRWVYGEPIVFHRAR